jgi:hypothetical protein
MTIGESHRETMARLERRAMVGFLALLLTAWAIQAWGGTFANGPVRYDGRRFQSSGNGCVSGSVTSGRGGGSRFVDSAPRTGA